MRENDLTDAELDAIEERCAAATPGPWKSFVEGRDHDSGDSLILTPCDDIYLTGTTIADQDFIAHARVDVVRLLQEVRRRRTGRGTE